MSDFFNKLSGTVSDFIQNRISTDEAEMLSIREQGRAVLYNQLAEAYRIGLILVEPKNRIEFCKILSKYNLDGDAERLANGKFKNIWSYVTNLLYRKISEDGLIFEINRSSEKYANVFRYLHTQGVSADEAANYIANFKGATANGLLGLERADREANSKGSSDNATKSVEHVEYGRSPAIDDVVQFDMPSFWCDEKRFTAESQYGMCWFEVRDGRVYLFDRHSIDAGRFKALAEARGRRIAAKLKAQKRAADKLVKASHKKLKAAEKIRTGDADLAEIKLSYNGILTENIKSITTTLNNEYDESVENANKIGKYVIDLSTGRLPFSPINNVILNSRA